MCSIFGFVGAKLQIKDLWDSNEHLQDIICAASDRGRDGRGWVVDQAIAGFPGSNRFSEYRNTSRVPHDEMRAFLEAELQDSYGLIDLLALSATVIGNMRAEPTTEYVEHKNDFDQQPYVLGGWRIVHNGTIANDKELRTHALPTKIDSAAIVEQLVQVSEEICTESNYQLFRRVINKLKGSYAILATREGDPTIYFACNYRPIWYVSAERRTYISSSRHHFPDSLPPAEMVQPYSIGYFNMEESRIDSLLPEIENPRALVVCSGGLDSTVAAAWACKSGRFAEVELAHFLYGSRAEGPESDRVMTIAEALGVSVKFFNMKHLYDPEDSPLLQADSAIAGGEAGAEFAHEWVPARNLMMLAVATAYAEAKGFHTLILGNNLEEAGAYPDNEPEFIERFNDMLPFAVGDGKSIRVEMPVGNMMKHEIVELGAHIGAPLHLTWSCYRAGKLHCGKCGPCYMRRTAFAINKLDEVIQYQEG